MEDMTVYQCLSECPYGMDKNNCPNSMDRESFNEIILKGFPEINSCLNGPDCCYCRKALE